MKGGVRVRLVKEGKSRVLADGLRLGAVGVHGLPGARLLRVRVRVGGWGEGWGWG